MRLGVVLALASLSVSGCLYGFAGGGLPAGIKTVAVLPFDNLTAEPTLTQEINASVREAVQGRLGLRQAGEQQADAVVRGTITRYDPDVPVAYSGVQDSVRVDKRLVQITVSVEVFDQKNGKPLWERAGMMLEGDYEPGRESERDGRRKALEKLVTNIVEGAQSQW